MFYEPFRHSSYLCLLLLCLLVAWWWSPGLPLQREPQAEPQVRQAGMALFVRQWQADDPLAAGDGLGPVFNANSCAACHFQGGIVGGGASRNVLAFEVLPSTRDPKPRAGLIHSAAILPTQLETEDLVHELFPAFPESKRVIRGCGPTRIAKFDPVRIESINATALFGAGWVDRISPKAIVHNQRRRLLANMAQELKNPITLVQVGERRVLPDGRIGKFGWKAQFATLAEFVAAACANELGLGNPKLAQARPLGSKATEAPKRDLNSAQFNAMVSFVDMLPRPVQILPDDRARRHIIARGKQLFHATGCAECHVPKLGGVDGVYSDFLLYRLTSRDRSGYRESNHPAKRPLPSTPPAPDQWRTPPLWGVADSAPYFHDGASPTLERAILRHEGAAKRVTARFKKLGSSGQAALIAFLQTLTAPPKSEPNLETDHHRMGA